MRVYGIKDNECGFMEVENDLGAEQAFVGGYIEVLGIGNGIDLVCNEEGKINGLIPTIAWIEDGEVIEIICGNCFFCRSMDGIKIREEYAELVRDYRILEHIVDNRFKDNGRDKQIATVHKTLKKLIKNGRNDLKPLKKLLGKFEKDRSIEDLRTSYGITTRTFKSISIKL